MRDRSPAIARRELRRAHSFSRALLALAFLLGSACDLNFDPDLTNDGVVNVLDVSYASSCQGADPKTDCRCARADLEGDGDVDAQDLENLKNAFGTDGYPIDAPDGTAPSLTIERPLDESIAVANRMRVRGVADEELFGANVAGVQASIDPEDARRFEAWVTLDAGLNAIQVQAQDRACNAGTARVRVTWDVALDPDPTGDGKANILDVSLVSSCQQADLATDCRCRRADLDRSGAVDQVDLDAVKDAFGGDGFPIQPRDRTAPLVTIVDPTANATLAASPYDVTGTVDDATATVRVNGVAAELTPGTPPTYRANIPLAAGANRIDVDAEDAACNVGRAGVDVSLAPVLASLELVPRGLRFSEIAGSKPFQVLGHYSDGTTRDLTLASTGTTYEVERLYVAQLSPDGVASPAGSGLTRVTARNGGLEARGKVIVEEGVELLELTVDPESSTLRARGAGVALRATGRFSDGTTRDLTDPEEGTVWASAGPAIVAVSPEGVASAVAPGAVAVTATNQALSDDAQVAVVLAGGDGFVRGEVYDDTRGLPLAGAIAELLADGAGSQSPPIAATADDTGRWTLPGAAGETRVRVRRDGFTQVERRGELPELAANELVDARLTPLDANESPLSVALGGTATSAGDATVQLEVPPGALGAAATLRLTRVSPQGLAALLPPGWSPIAAVDVSPAGASLSAPATLRARASIVPDASRLAAARFDAGSGAWIALDRATLQVNGRDVAVATDVLAPIVFAIADAEPEAPPAVVAGAPLPGVATALATDSLDAEGEVAPAAAPVSPDARADGVVVAHADAPIASGLILRGAVRERYDLLDATRVEPRPFTQDLVVYQLPAAQPGARGAAFFPITPSRAYTVQELAAGAVLIDVIPAPATPRSGDVIDAAGGSVADDDARVAIVPAGALSVATPIAIRALDPNAFAVLAAPGLDLLDAFELDLAGASLAAPIALRIPRPADARDGDELVWAERFRAADGIPRLRVVAFGVAQGTSVGSELTRGDVTLPGIAREGALVLLRARSPLAFATGAVTDGAGGVAADRLVTSAEFADLTAPDGSYLVARSAPAAATLRARDFASGDTAAASLAAATPLALERVDFTLGADAPRVVAVRPANGATDVAPAASLEVDFSEAIDPASVDATALALSTPGGAVPVALFLSADGRTLRAVPQSALASATPHEWNVGGALRDRNGTALEAFAALAFTVLDTSKPPQPEAGRITARLPDESGFVRIDGTQGTAKAGAFVTITNLRTRETTTVLAQPDGSFRLQIGARIGDELTLTLRDPDDRELTVAITQFDDPDGTAAIGEVGGRFTDAAGRVGTLLPRALRSAGLFSFGPLDPNDVPDPGAGFSALDPFALGAEGAAFRQLRSLTLHEAQTRFADAIAERAPFASAGSFFVPDDFLANANVRFEAIAEDEDGARIRAALATVVVERDPDGAAREAIEGARFPRVELRAPAEVLRGAELAASATAAAARVDLDLPAPAALDADADVLLARVIEVDGERLLSVVDRFTRADVGGTLRLLSGDASFPGAAAGGDYVLLASDGPLAELTGVAAGPQTLVVLDGTNVAFATDGANGRFALPVPAGAAYTLRFLDLATGEERDTISGIAPGAGEIADLGDPLAPPGAALEVSGEPRGDAVADVGASIALRFSEPIDAASVGAATILVRDAAGVRVPGAFAISDDGVEVSFEPQRRLHFGTRYRYTVTTDVRAQSGARLATPASEAFTTFAPRVVATRSFTNAGGTRDAVRDVAARGTLALAATASGLRVLDVRRPDLPLERTAVPIADGAAGVALFDGALVDRNGAPVLGPIALATGGGAAEPGRLWIYGVELPGAPRFLGAAQLTTRAGDTAPPGVPNAPGSPSSVLALDGGRAAIAVRDLGVATVDLGQAIPDAPADPGGALGPRTDGSARELAVLGASLTAVGAPGLSVIDGTSLANRATFATGGEALGVDALDDFELETGAVDLVAVANGNDGTLQFFDARDPEQPARIGVLRVGHGITGVALDREEKLAYVTGGARGVVLVDLDGAVGVQPEDFDADGIDDRILGRVETDGGAQRIAVDAGRGVAYVADAEQGLAVVQIAPPRARIAAVSRDPLANASGDEAPIDATRTAYVTDRALLVDIEAVTPPGESLFLTVAESPTENGAPVVELPEGGALFRLGGSNETVRLPIDAPADSSGGQVRLVVQDADGASVAAYELNLAADDPTAAPAVALFVAPESHVFLATGEAAPLELGAILADGSVRNRTAAPGTNWSSLEPAVASVDAAGLATAVSGGTTSARAASGALEADASLEVDAPPALLAIEASPAFLSLRAIGATTNATALGTFGNGATGAVGAADGITYDTGDASVATVDANGVVTATGVGVTQIEIRAGALRSVAQVEVEDRPAAVVTGIELDALAQPVSLDQRRAVVTGRVVGSGGLELLDVTLALSGAASGEVQGVTDRRGAVTWNVADLAAGVVSLEARVVDPSSGATRRATGAFTVVRGSGDGEPNESVTSASPLASGREIEGALGAGDGADFFRVDAGGGGTLVVTLANAEGALPEGLVLVLRDPNTGAEIARYAVPPEGRVAIPVGAGAAVVALEGGPAALLRYRLAIALEPGAVVVDGVAGQGGGPGSTLVLTGSGFHPEIAGNVVRFGDFRATITSATPTELRVRVPANAVNGLLEVQVGAARAIVDAVDVGRAGLPPPPSYRAPDPAFTRSDPVSGAFYVANRLLVEVTADVARADVDAIAARAGASVAGFLPSLNLYSFEWSDAPPGAFDARAAALEAEPGVVGTLLSVFAPTAQAHAIDARDGHVSLTVNPGVTLEPHQAWASARVLDAVDTVRRTPPFVTAPPFQPIGLAIIDTGVDPLVANEFGPVTIYDPRNASTIDPLTQLLNPVASIADASGHGTSVLSVAASRNDGQGSSGVFASLLKASEPIPFRYEVYAVGADCNGSPCMDLAGTFRALEDMARRARNARRPLVHVLNLSFCAMFTPGTIPTGYVTRYLDAFTPFAGQTLITIGAGNSGANAMDGVPAVMSLISDHVMTVGATGALDAVDRTGESADARAIFGGAATLPANYPAASLCQVGSSQSSNCGEMLTIVAPGEDLIVARSQQPGPLLPYKASAGTSLAAPFVAGVAAMVQAIGDPANARRPFAPEELRRLLVRTADDVTIPWNANDRLRRSPIRRINALSAVLEVLDPSGATPILVVDQDLPDPANATTGAVIAIPSDPVTGVRRGATDRMIPLAFSRPGFQFVGRSPRGAASSPLGDEMYVVVEATQPPVGDGLLVIDTRQLAAIDFIPFATATGARYVVGAGTPSIAVTPDARLAYVNGGAEILVVDLAGRRRIVEMAQLPAPLRPANARRQAGVLPARLAAIASAATSRSAGTQTALDGGITMPFDDIRSLAIAPDGNTLYAALGSGLGGGNQPGAVMAIDVDLTRDADPATADIQPDGSRYLTIGKPPLGFPDYLDMIEMDPDSMPGPQPPYIPSTYGDEPSDVAVDFDAAHVYLAHGGLDVARGMIPDSSPTSGFYDALLTAGALGSLGGGISGGISGMLIAASGNLIQYGFALERMRREQQELLESGATAIIAPGYTGVFTPGANGTGSQTWFFPSVLNFGWAPPAGRSIISQTSNSERFVSRPARLVVDRLDPDGFGLFAYRMTGNFGVLSRTTQELFKTHVALSQPNGFLLGADAPSDQLFHGLVAVTRSIELDNHAWPDGGRFPASRTPGGPRSDVPSEEESSLFANDLALATSGGFAVATNAGPGAQPGKVSAFPDFEHDEFIQGRLEERGFTISGGVATRGNESFISGSAADFEIGGGGVSIVDTGAIKRQLAADAATAVDLTAPPAAPDRRPWFQAFPVDGVVTRLRHWEKAPGVRERFWRPRGVAIEPSLVIPAPRNGAIMNLGSRLELRWREPAIAGWRARVWDLDVRNPDGEALEVRSVSGQMPGAASSDKRFSISLAELMGTARGMLVSGHRYRVIFAIDDTAGRTTGRARVETTYAVPRSSREGPSGCRSEMRLVPAKRRCANHPDFASDPSGAQSEADTCIEVLFDKGSRSVNATLSRNPASDARTQPITLVRPAGQSTAVTISPASEDSDTANFSIELPRQLQSGEHYPNTRTIDLDMSWSTNQCTNQHEVVRVRPKANTDAVKECLDQVRPGADALTSMCTLNWTDFGSFSRNMTLCLEAALPFEPDGCRLVIHPEYTDPRTNIITSERRCTGPAPAFPVMIRNNNGAPQVVNVNYARYSIQIVRLLPDGQKRQIVQNYELGTCRSCNVMPAPDNRSSNSSQVLDNDLQSRGVCGNGAEMQQIESVLTTLFMEWEPIP